MKRICEYCCTTFEGRPSKKTCSTSCRNKRGYAMLTRNQEQLTKVKAWRTSPIGRYTHHRLGAKSRGIGFNLTFDEWFTLWQPYWNLGDGVRYCMCRTKDLGPYELGNVRIDTQANNNLEAAGLPFTPIP